MLPIFPKPGVDGVAKLSPRFGFKASVGFLLWATVDMASHSTYPLIIAVRVGPFRTAGFCQRDNFFHEVTDLVKCATGKLSAVQDH